MRTNFFKGAAFGALVGAITLMASSVIAGTGVGGVFNLGQANSVNASTRLAGAVNDAQLKVTNNSTGAAASGIAVTTVSGKPPFVVNSKTRVTNLNADTVDGVHASALQRRVAGTCARGTAIASVGADGSATCTTSMVVPISLTTAAGQGTWANVQPSPLLVTSFCHQGSTIIRITNNSASNSGTINWMFSEGGTSSPVNASGTSLGPFGAVDFNYGGFRLEGQFILSSGGWIATLNLHAFDGGSLCEVYGTANVGIAQPLNN